MRACSASDSSGVVMLTSSTLVNWCWRIMPLVSLPAAPASERKQGVSAVSRKRQLRLVHDLAGDEVGERHLGGRDQVMIAGGAEQIVAELGQLAGAEQRLGADQIGHGHLGVAVLAGLQRQHELADRPLERGELAPQRHEARARHPRRPGEVHAERGADLVVRLRVEGEVARIAPAPQLDVAPLVGAVGHVVGQDVGEGRQQRVLPRLQLAQAPPRPASPAP